jgi:hypothetical protein
MTDDVALGGVVLGGWLAVRAGMAPAKPARLATAHACHASASVKRISTAAIWALSVCSSERACAE